MAVDVTTNPWIVPFGDVSGNKIWPSNVFVEHFEFVDYGLDTDSVTVKNGAGKVVWKANGAADLQEVRSGKIGIVHGGMIVDQMSAGTLRVYIR